jgi:oxygen-independent coproporphyrinogen-3 oxidase
MEKPGLYVHIPFCRTKCPYCGFYSLASPSLIPRWLSAFEKEVLLYKNRFGCFDSLYMGGGTPTTLALKDLENVIERLFTNFRFAPDTEITIEANPADLTREKTDGIKAIGFNRVNLGIQSFNDRDLLFLGRNHRAGEAIRAMEQLRISGFNNVGADLIYGFKGQSLKGWMSTLKQALVLRPEHLSCYQLTFEKKTPFWRMKETGRLLPVSEKKEEVFFLETSRFLEDAGYIHYEISNFAREAAYRSRHNRKYWTHAPYLGLGPSAHSFQDSVRWWNFRSVKRYCEALEGRKSPVEESEKLTREQIRLESVALGLRTGEGFQLEDKMYHDPGLQDILAGLQHSGFLTVNNGNVTASKKGFLVADHLPLYLLP